MTVKIVTYGAVAIILLGIFVKFFVKKYDDYERAIIFQFGKFNRIAGPGWSIVLPFFEKEFQRIDIRTKTLDMFLPVVFTNDDLRLKIDSVIYYRITDPTKAILKIDNYMVGLSDMIKSETRNLIASMSMRQIFSRLDTLNDLLAEKIRHAAWNWGIDVPMVQVRGVSPPEEIALAMEQKEMTSQYLQAEKFRAEAKKVVIEAIGEGARKLDDRGIMYLYIKALQDISSSSSTKLVLPMQFTDVMKGVGTGVGIGAGIDLNSAVSAVKDKIMASE
jgi:regulator of protease activity HflC (stomatin/prohibitin superfamily)